VQDAATGLTYMQQRYYDPQVGVFLSVDPIAAYDTPVALFNRYRYANNNPFRFTDPDGRFGQPQCYGGRFCDSYKKSGCELTCVGREETEESRKKVSDEGDDALGPMKDRAYSILSKPAGDDGIVNLSMAEFGQLLDYEVAATELKSSLRGGYDNLSTIELLYEARVGDSLFYGDFGGVDYRITGTDGAVIGPYKGGDFNYIKQGIIFSEGKGARLDMHLIVQSWNISGGGTFLHTKRRQFIADIGYFYNEMKSDD
jgi:RHS repeat-associated protein